MKAVDSSGPLRAFSWARLSFAALLLALAPGLPPNLTPDLNRLVLGLALLAVVLSSVALLTLTPVERPRRIAWLVCLLDVALVTAIVASTGGARSIFAFLYVLAVMAACMLLSRTGGLAIAAAASALYAGLVFGRTVLPVMRFLDPLQESTGLEVLTIFLNAATFLLVAIVAGGLAERFQTTRAALETQERDLRDLEAFKDLVFQSVDTGLVALDRRLVVTAFNRAAEEMTGVRAGQAIGRPWAALFPAAADLDAVEAALDDDPRRSSRHETALTRPDGTAVPVRITFSPLRAGDGQRVGLIAACEDLSAIREMEARMRRADRLAALGRLSANIAHEIRNPLAALTGAIEALVAPAAPEDARERLADIVLKEAARLNRIIKDFLDYARPAPLQRVAVDVVEIVDEILVLLEHQAAAGTLKITREMPATLAWPLDPLQFRQAAWNLCVNAVEAMPNGGELTVGLEARDGALEMRVTDTGVGIGPDEIGHVFEPFYSTKPEGSGLGLALVHRVAQDHGGSAHVTSVVGGGSAFTLTLPARG